MSRNLTYQGRPKPRANTLTLSVPVLNTQTSDFHFMLSGRLSERSEEASPNLTFRAPVRNDIQPNLHFLLRVKISDLHLGIFTNAGSVCSNHTFGIPFSIEFYVSYELTVVTARIEESQREVEEERFKLGAGLCLWKE